MKRWTRVTVFLFVLGLASLTQAAWTNVYTEDFQSLNTGSLDGQNGWSAIAETDFGVLNTVVDPLNKAVGQTAASGAGWYYKPGVADYQDIKMTAQFLLEDTHTAKSGPNIYLYARAENAADPESGSYVRLRLRRQWSTDHYSVKYLFGTDDGSIGSEGVLISDFDGSGDMTVEFSLIDTALKAVIYLGGTEYTTLTATTDAAHVNAGSVSFRIIGSNDADGKISMDNLALAVPEPATLALLAFGGSAAFLRRRRQ